MKCVRCDRPLLRAPAATIPTAGGAACWGPKCAVLAGLIRPKRRGPNVITRRRRKAAGTAQIDWVEQLCGAA